MAPPVTFVVKHVPLSDSITNIPEFHDCQRFVATVRRRQVYSGLFAVFASYHLDSLRYDEQKSQDTITVPYRDTTILVKTVPVATIFSDHGQYVPLGIGPGFNCLLLYRLPAPVLWGAKMIPLTRPDSSCLSVDPHREGTVLQVKASSVPRLTEADYPAAARWDWDPVHKEQYIGIKCEAAWCQVGRVGFDTSASYSGPPLPFVPIRKIPLSGAPKPFTPAELSRVTRVKGWYDEQWLATSGAQGPSALRGTLIPNPHIHKLAATLDVYDATWVQVGFAYVRGGDYHKWNYRQAVNEVSLCHGSASACNVDTSQPPEPPSKTALASCDWWASVKPFRIVAGTDGAHLVATGTVKYFCLTVTDHSTELAILNSRFPNMVSSIPGTARWRWLANDEGSWFGCRESGCCSPK